MKWKLILSLISNIIFSGLSAQSIYMDGFFEDWETIETTFADEIGDGGVIDIASLSVANDELFLYLKIELTSEVALDEGNELVLYIDADRNPATGLVFNELGAELVWNFGSRIGYFVGNGSQTLIDCNDLELIALPSFGHSEFEIAIRRDIQPTNADLLFNEETISIALKDIASGDILINGTEGFEFTFSNYINDFESISLDLSPNTSFRLMSYNTLFDGLTDPARIPSYERIVAAISPDIITFNETWSTTASEAEAFMNNVLADVEWYVAKNPGNNITVSKYPIIQSWDILPGSRLFATLIDIPEDISDRDILIINAHLSCCDKDENRQTQADAFAQFIHDALIEGDGIIDLPVGTPIILSGDLNLVGLGGQYHTLTTGDIQSEFIWGADAPLDWDATGFADTPCYLTDRAQAITWGEESESFCAGRLDYFIYSNSVLNPLKSFALQTAILPPAKLNQYGLLAGDSNNASDHLPIAADFEIKDLLVATNEPKYENIEVSIYPNPCFEMTSLDFYLEQSQELTISIRSLDGSTVQHLSPAYFQQGTNTIPMDLSHFSTGIYLVEIAGPDFVKATKVIKL